MVFLITGAEADVRLPRLLGDNMVLQRDQPIPVWGWAAAGEKVNVRLGKSSVSATAAADGAFEFDHVRIRRALSTGGCG